MVSDKVISLPSISERDASLVESQLSKILTSPQFKSAQQMQRFLRYVIEKAQKGEGNQLKQYTIAVEALGFPDDFDSDSNPSVRIMGGRVRERLDKYYQEEGKNDSLIVTIPKGSYCPQIKKQELGSSPSVSQEVISQGPKLGLFCFDDKNESKESNHLCAQISSTLAKELSHFLFSRLYVQVPYLGSDRSVLMGKEAKRNHEIDFTLFIFVYELPNKKYELIYRLWDNDSEEVISSEIHDVYRGQAEEERNNILNKISAVVADLYQGKLHTCWARKLLKDESSIPERFQTVAYYRYYADNLGREAFKKAVSYCTKALQRDSKDIIANVMLADYCRRDYVYNYKVIEAPLEKGKASAEMATRLRPDSHEAHFVLGQLLFCLNDWERSIGEFNLARDISKNHVIIEYGTGFHFCLMGHWKEGLALTRKIMTLSGSYPDWYHFTPFLDHYRNNNYQEALVEALKITTPNLLHGPASRCAAYRRLGETENAEKELQALLAWCPSFLEDGKEILMRFLGSKELAEKIWDGINPEVKNLSKD